MFEGTTAEATGTLPDPEDLFDEGMEEWWAGRRPQACGAFRRVLTLDPEHADAHNHLGVVCLEEGRLEAAEAHFEAAIKGGARKLRKDGEEVRWGDFENRPYLRGIANLALVRRRQGRYADAIELHQRLLRLDPDDGIRASFFLGEEWHRLGDLDRSIAAYLRDVPGPDQLFGLALALFARGDREAAALKLLAGIATNPHVAAMLLEEVWEEPHEGSLPQSEPDWASAYLEDAGDLWATTSGALDFLRFWWSAGPVRLWRTQLDEARTARSRARARTERDRAAETAARLTSEGYLRELIALMKRAS